MQVIDFYGRCKYVPMFTKPALYYNIHVVEALKINGLHPYLSNTLSSY